MRNILLNTIKFSFVFLIAIQAVSAGTVSGNIYTDRNWNGIYDQNYSFYGKTWPDINIPFYKVELKNNQTGSTVSTSSNLTGKYSFTNIPNGNYTLTQSGYNGDKSIYSTLFFSENFLHSKQVSVSETSTETVNFGMVNKSVITGFVYKDKDTNSSMDSFINPYMLNWKIVYGGDVGLKDQSVFIIKDSPTFKATDYLNGNICGKMPTCNQVAFTTDANGYFEISDLTPGKYHVFYLGKKNTLTQNKKGYFTVVMIQNLSFGSTNRFGLK